MSPSHPTAAPRPGELGLGWRWTVGVAWFAIVCSLTIVAGAAEVINRSVWWIGDRGDRAPIVFVLIPFVMPFVVILAAVRAWRSVVEWSFVAALATLAVGVGDRGNSPSAAVVVGALGVAGLLVSIAAVSGRARTRV